LFSGIKNFLLFFIINKKYIKPWMQPQEIILIKEILRKKKPKKCLEWGAGFSTIYFPRYLKKDAQWFAIEHDKKWFKKIKKLNYYCNVKLYLIPPNNFPWTDLYGDGSFSDLRDYVQYPEKVCKKFDFILIDGRARAACMKFARKLLNTDGVIILHDAGRTYYHKSFELYKYKELFTDFRPEVGVWIGSLTLNLKNVMDINMHKLNWKILEKIRKIRVVHHIHHRALEHFLEKRIQY